MRLQPRTYALSALCLTKNHAIYTRTILVQVVVSRRNTLYIQDNYILKSYSILEQTICGLTICENHQQDQCIEI